MSDQTTSGTTASSLLASATNAAGDALGEARDRAAGVASRTAKAAKAEAMDRAEDAKDGLADQGERLARTLRGALDQGDDSIQSKLMAAAADSVTDLSNTLRGKSFEQLVANAGEFARRSPGAFVAAAALAGFAVARFARASSPAASLYGGIEGAGAGSAYGSPRQMGSGYAGGVGMAPSQSQAGYGSGRTKGGSVSTSSLSTHDDDFEDSSVDATPDADRRTSSLNPGATFGSTPSGFGS